jgi:hypothetical protein
VTGQRVHERFPIRLPVTVVHEGRSFETVTRNLSLGGAFVELESDIPFGAAVRVQLRVPKSTELIEVESVIRWKQADGLGVQFGSLRALDTWALNQLFKAHAAST